MLPRLPYNIPGKSNQIVSFLGINYTDNYQDGHLENSMNLSTHRYPYISTRRGRRLVDTGVTALSAWGDHKIHVKSGKLYYDDKEICAFPYEGKMQFAKINSKLVVNVPGTGFYVIDTEAKTITDPKVEFTRASGVTVNDGDITFTSSISVPFAEQDAVKVTSSGKDFGYQKITKIESNKITFTNDCFKGKTGSVTNLSIKREVPDLDYIFVAANRVWGVSNEAQTIYSSHLGDPTNWFDYSGTADDSYALAVASPGNFTAACNLGSSLLFWKEGVLHKILGSYPAEYQMYQYNINGVREGCYKSVINASETLVYMSRKGLYTYNGGTASFLSQALGEHSFENASAGFDGENYFFSGLDNGETGMYKYSFRNGIWLREDATDAKDFAYISGALYFLDNDGNVWLEDSGEEDTDLEWECYFKPFYETSTGSYNRTGRAYEFKRYTKLVIRLETTKLSKVFVHMKTDNGVWKLIKTFVGKEDGVKEVVVPIGRCDRAEVKLTGKGTCVIKQVMKEFILGGRK